MFSCYVIGETALAFEACKVLKASSWNILGILTVDEKLAFWAKQNQIPHYSTLKIFRDNIEYLEDCDFLFSIVNMHILRKDILKIVKRFSINFHDSLLPNYAGLNAIPSAIFNNETTHGITWHQITEDVDSGNILMQSEVGILSDETTFTLNLKCYEKAILDFKKLEKMLREDTFSLVPQDFSLKVSCHPSSALVISSIIQWHSSAEKIDRVCRSLSFGESVNNLSAPKFLLKNQYYALKKHKMSDQISTKEPGTIVEISKESATISTGSYDIFLYEVYDLTGTSLSLPYLLGKLGYVIGDILLNTTADAFSHISELYLPTKKQEKMWLDKLLNMIEKSSTASFLKSLDHEEIESVFDCQDYIFDNTSELTALTSLFLSLYYLNNNEPLVLWLRNGSSQINFSKSFGLFPEYVPVEVNFSSQNEILDAVHVVNDVLALISKTTYCNDIFLRQPLLKSFYHSKEIIINFGEPIEYSNKEFPHTKLAFNISHDRVSIFKANGVTYVDSNDIFDTLKNIAVLIEQQTHIKIKDWLILPQESARRFASWNQTDFFYPLEDTVLTLFARQIESIEPNKIAVFFNDQSYTYASIDQKSNQLARHIRFQYQKITGEIFKPDTLVPLFVTRGIDMLIGVLGILKAGGAYVPLDANYPPDRLLLILKDIGSVFLLTQSHLTASFSAGVDQAIVLLDHNPYQNEQIDTLSFNAGPAHLAYVIYTSGTTGKPKGVMITHQSLTNLLLSIKNTLGVRDGERFLALTSMSFDIAGLEWYLPLITQGEIVLTAQDQTKDIYSLLQLINFTQPSIIQATPSLWAALIDSELQLTRSVKILVGGEALSRELANRLLTCSDYVWNVYGPTETTIWSSYSRVKETGVIDIGQPLANTQMYILNKDGHRLPIGAVGELYIGGKGLARGYLNQPTLTVERFIDSPFSVEEKLYKTGDLARWTPEGNIEYVGRNDFQVKIRGFRIELSEIEQALLKIPGIKYACVLPKENIAGTGIYSDLVGYYILDASVIKDQEKTAIDSWASVYDAEYSDVLSDMNVEEDFAIWKSYITSQPISLEEMRDWRENALDHIRSLPSKTVLEIGVGSGLIMYPLLPEVDEYVGLDISNQIIDRHLHYLQEKPYKVKLHCLAADQLECLDSEKKFDCVILNSVCQYFSGIHYFLQVLTQALKKLKPDGSLFLGDIRDFALHEELIKEKLLHENGSYSESNINKALVQEKEFLIAKEYFKQLAKACPELRIELFEKKSRYNNELTKYRYDVKIKVGTLDKHFSLTQFFHYPAFYNLPFSSKITSIDIELKLKKMLPDYMLPTDLLEILTLPITINGKVDRQRLLALEFVSRRNEYIPPQIPLAKAMAELWSKILSVKNVGLKDNFFHLGGNSISVTSLVSQIRRIWNVKFSLTQFYKSPDLGSVVTALMNAETESLTTTTPLRPDKMPLSFAQQRLFFMDRFLKGKPIYNIPLAWRLTGKIDISALEKALNGLLARHEVLRTALLKINEDDAYQEILSPEACHLTLNQEHLTTILENGKTLSDRIESETFTVFNLSTPPLLKATLIEESEASHVLLLTMHHVISDGWSFSIIANELSAYYNYHAYGKALTLPMLSMQYADYTIWQQEYLQGELLEKQLAYWASSLENAPTSTNFPTDYPRPEHPTYQGRKHYHVLSHELSKKLYRLAKTHSCTLFEILLTTLKILLYRYTHQEQIVVGTAFANRDNEITQNLIGFFVNTLALNTRINEEDDFSSLLFQVHEKSRLAHQNQDIPFEQLVTHLKIDRHLNQNPLFQVMFIMQNNERPNWQLENIKVDSIVVNYPISKFDLNVQAVELESGQLSLSIEYATDLFKIETIERLMMHYQELLRGAVLNSKTKIKNLPLLTVEEKNLKLMKWNQTSQEIPYITIHELFEEQVRKTPNHIAVIFETQELTYLELNKRANQLARYLNTQGLKENDFIVLCLERSIECVIAILAILKVGATAVPIDLSMPLTRKLAIFAELNPSFLLTSSTYSDFLGEEFSATIYIDTLNLASYSDEDLTSNIIVSPSTYAYVFYTSGSTGKPKGVTQSHAAIINLVLWMKKEFPLDNNDKILQLIGPHFDPSVRQLFYPLISGGTAVLLRHNGEKDVLYLCETLIKNKIHGFFCVPTLLDVILEKMNVYPPLFFNFIQRIFCLGEPLPPTLVLRCHQQLTVEICNQYGPTECTGNTTFERIPYSQQKQNIPISIGKPISNMRTYLLDKSMHPVPIGVVGELYIAGAGVSDGYLNDQPLTHQKFINNPFADSGEQYSKLYKTGDLFRYDTLGRLFFVGRSDYQFKIRGMRVEPKEIENLITSAISSIRQVLVVLHTDQSQSKRLVAYLLVANIAQYQLDCSYIKSILSRNLPDYMTPEAFILVEKFPINVNGKIDRASLPEPVFTYETEYVSPESPLAVNLIYLCERILKKTGVGLQDNFFSLGGNSILVLNFLMMISRKWKVEVQIQDFFRFSSLYDLVKSVEELLKIGSSCDLRWRINRRTSSGTTAELSFSQQRLWFLDKLVSGQSIYNIPLALRLQGEVNIEALEKSLLRLAQRHEVLRTRFRGKESAYQEIFSLAEYGFSLHEESRSHEEMTERLREEALRRFDLSEGPLWRASLLKVLEEDSSQLILLLTFHHSIADAWSLSIMSRELSIYYNHYAYGKEINLLDLPIQYADYSVWQRNYLQGPVLEEQLSYWKSHLEGAPGSLDLPTDYLRPKKLEYRGARYNKKLEVEVSQQLRDVASKHRSTLFMVLLSAFKILLHRYSQQNDIVIGTVFSNRYRQETQGLIGFFANTIALRSQITSEETFLSLLAKIRELSLLAQQYQDMPFEMLVNHLKIDPQLNRNPLFQVMFVMQNNEQARWDLEGLEVERLQVDYPVSKFDMTLEAFDRADGIHLSFEYSTELFKEETIDRLMDHFEYLLTSIVSHPEERIAFLPMLSKEEIHQQLVTRNQTEKPYPQTTLHELFEQQVERTPDNIAVVFEDQQLTYQELNKRANQLARHLRQKHLEKRGTELQADTPIAICVERSSEMLIGILAILKAGGAYVAIDKNHPDERIGIILSDIDAVLVLTEWGFLSRLGAIKSDLESIIISDGSYASELKENLSLSYSAAGLAYIVYTSGSTGIPKGVMGTHQGMVNRLSWMWSQYPFTETDICCHKTSFNFVDAMAEFFLPLLQGIRLHILNSTTIQDGRALAAHVKRHSITRLVLVPSLLRTLLDIGEDFSSIKILVVSGEALNQDLIEKVARQAPHLTLLNLYGSSEVSADVTYTEVYSNNKIHSLGIGKPIDNMQVYVLDTSLHLLPRGVVGELYVSGVGLSRGYWRQKELTQERFIDNPFYSNSKLFKTGDLVRWNEADELVYLGRNDFQVKIRGQRIECGEIQYALVSLSSIKEAAVVAKKDELGDKRLVAYVVKKDSSVTDEEIQKEIEVHLKEKLPDYMRPSVVMILKKLPLNINGKLDHKALPEPMFKYADYVAPENPIATQVVRLCERIVEKCGLGLEDNFFHSGGNSLKSISFLSAISNDFSVDIKLNVFFNFINLQDVVDAIERGLLEETVVNPRWRIDRRTTSEAVESSFSQQRLWFLDHLVSSQSIYNIPLALRLQGELNVSALEKSLLRLAERHEVLRTRLIGKEKAYQHIIEISKYNISLNHELLIEPAQLSERLRLEALAGFDLSQGSLWRATLLTMSAGGCILLLTFHHSIADGWSLSVISRELSVYYNHYAHGKDLNFVELSIQYADYSVWQRGYLQGPVLEEQLAYWKGHLEGSPESLDFPTDYPRPKKLEYRGARNNRKLEIEVSQQLRDVASKHRSTLFMVLLSAFKVLLHQYSQQDDIVVGTVFANRYRQETQGLIGFFANTIALRSQITSDETFLSLLMKIRESSLSAHQYQDMPFEMLVNHLALDKALNKNPLFQVMFVMQNNEQAKWDLDGLEVERLRVDYPVSKFDMTLEAFDRADGIHLSLEYSTELFKEETINRLMNHFERLLVGIISNPEKRVAALPMLSEEEIHQQLVTWNQTEKPYPQTTLHELFEQQVERTPDNVAIVFEDQQLTYRELNERANQVAHYLRQQGIGSQPDMLVGLGLERSFEMIIGILAILKAGGAYVPLDSTHPDDRLSYMLADTQVKFVLTQSHLVTRWERLSTENTFFVAVALDTPTTYVSFSSENLANIAQFNHLAYVIYTSGTTGKPKGVMLEHNNVVNYLFNVNDKFKDIQRIDFSSELTFDLSVTTTLYPICFGKTVYPFKPSIRELHKFIEHLTRHNIELVKSTPALMSLLSLSMKDHYRLKYCIVGGEKLTDAHKNQILTYCDLILDEYGPTETTVGSTTFEISLNTQHLSIGKSYFNYHLYILNNQFNFVPIGVIGELYIAGTGLARGYLNDAKLTAERFIWHRFDAKSEPVRLYKTGDLVRYKPDGNLEYIGRKDLQVKIRGYRIECGEIESQLLKQEGVTNATVLVREESGNKQLVAYVASSKPIDQDVKNLRRNLLEYLPEYMVPAHFQVLDSMPITVNGKVDRKALERMPIVLLDQGEYVSPSNELEQTILHVWQSVLRVERIGVHAKFSELGGDSIQTLQVVLRLNQAGYLCTLQDVYHHQTIADLAVCLASKSSTTAEQGVLEGSFGLLPIQQWFFRQNFSTPGHWNQSFLVKVPPLSLSRLQACLSSLVDYHDALRMRFHEQTEQRYAAYIDIPDIRVLDIKDHQESEIKAVLTEWQNRFDIVYGPLFQIGYLTGYDDGSARLYFAFHHLIIDTVSWRILIDDIKRLYEGKSLGVKSSSYRQWVNAVGTYKDKYPEEEPYWSSQLISENSSHALSSSCYSSIIDFDIELTKQLLEKTSNAYHTEINDILLTALSYALSKQLGHPEVWICLEGHGREIIDEETDVSRTAGWFTIQYPVCLKVQENIGESIQHIKETLRMIPRKGIGFSCFYPNAVLPGVTFNYLGQFDRATLDWKVVRESSGRSVSVENIKPCYLAMNGSVIEGKLHFQLNSFTSQEVVNALGQSFKEHLTAIVTHCVLQEKTHYTVSDFNTVKLTQSALNQLQSQDDSIEAIYPANSLQRGFIFHALSQPKDDAYRVQFLFDYEGDINIDLYQEAWRLTIQKFPMLRAYFNWGSEVIQIITRKNNLLFHYKDIRHAEDKEKALRSIQQDDRQQAFDLQQPTLLRICLIQRNDQAFTLLKSTHHSIEDGWSSQVVLKTVHEYYLTLLKGEKAVVIEDACYLRAQDYIARHQASALQLWRSQLECINEANDINRLLSQKADLSKAKTVNDPQSTLLTISGENYEHLKQMSRSEGITLHEICQFAWHKILQAYTQDEYTVVGTTVSGRSLPLAGIESSAGLYINTVPLVVDWCGDKSVLDQLWQIRENMQFINEYSFVDLSSLQKGGQRLFHSLLIFENYPVQKPASEKSLFKVNFRKAIEKVDYLLSLVIYEFNGSLMIRLNYDATYLEKSKAEKFLFEFERILEQLPKKLRQKHSEVTLLTDQERCQQLINWNQTEKIYTNTTIHQLFEAQVIKSPENVALVFENTAMTYKELNFRSNKLAHYLREQGIGTIPDMLVGIGVNRSFEMIIGILAILKAGGAYVPMDPDYPNDRLSYMIKDTKIRLLLTQENIFDRWQSINSIDCIEILCIDNVSLFDSYSSENPSIITLPQHLAYILYTSGSTGRPKGVMLNHEGIINRIEWMQAEYLLTSDDSVLQKTPFIFDVSVWELFWANWYGARIVIAKPDGHKNPEYIEQLIVEHNVTIIHFVPSMLSAFTSNLSSRHRSLHTSLRYIFCSGEALFFNQVQALMLLSQKKQVSVENLYGPTEASIDVTYYSCREKSEILIGKPISNIQLYIFGGNLELLPIGAVGELYIAGIGLAKGYLNQEQLTEERFIWHKFDAESEPIRLYKTGDLVRYSSDGNIAYIGRADSQIKLRGFRVELGEIEAIIARQNYIAKVAVLVKGDAENQHLVAFIETKQTDKTMMLTKYLLIKSLKKELVKYLPVHMLPSQIIVLNEILVGPTGKIDRKALANLPTNSSENLQCVLPRTLSEEKLVNIWRQVLQKEAVGVFDNFYSLGGNSITAVQLISSGLEQGITLTLAQLFEHPTIAELAELIVESAETQNHSNANQVEELQITEATYYKLTSMQSLIAKAYGHNEANDAIYHLQMSYLLEDNTYSFERFKEALSLMVAKHSIFRAAFRKTEDYYEQFIREELAFSVNETDISYLSVEQQNKYIDKFLQEDRSNLFFIDNQDEIFFRFNIFILNERQFEFIFIAHHIIADGWGIIIFLKELLSYYSLLKNNRALAISAAPNAHKYYVFHERNIIDSEAHKKFWRSYLKDVCYNSPSFMQPSLSNDSSTLCFKLDSDIYHFSVSLSQDLQVSLKSVFLSFYFDVLKDIFSNPESRLTVGVIVNGGRIPEISGSLGSLGLFWNMLPISLHYHPDKTQHIKQVHAHLTQVHSYSSYPLSHILENKSSENLFFSTYNFVQFDDVGSVASEFQIKQTRAYDKFHYPINFSININAKRSEVSCRIDYDKSKFNYETVLFLAERFQKNLVESYRNQFEALSVFSFFDKSSNSSSACNMSESEICFDM